MLDEERIATAKRTLEIMISKGNYNYSPYHFGMANGAILILSILEDKEPIYLERPDIWLEDINVSGEPVNDEV